MTEKRQPGRRTLLGAALGAGTVLGGAAAGTAQAAGHPAAAARPATAGGATPGGRGSGHGRLPVPAVIGHRGASGYRPEHTLGSYQLALDMGADIVEQDVVPTKDGHLVCRHENNITETTDVADHPEFAGRKTTKTVDGEKLIGWFTEDFTLAELKTLRAVERIPRQRQHNTAYDGRWEVPTFEEVLQWAEREGRRRGREVWLYVETKHPTFFRQAGLELEPKLAELLRRHGRHRRNSPLFVQSFEPSSIQRLAELVDNPGIVLLDALDSRPWDFTESGDRRTVQDLVTPQGLRWMSRFAAGIGPVLEVIIPRKKDDTLGEPSDVVRDAHAAGLLVHPYTVRNENSFLPADFRRGDDPNGYGNVFGVLKQYLATGIDALFSDSPDSALLAAEEFRS